MKTKAFILLLLVVAGFSSCITQSKCSKRYPPIADTAYITETVTIFRDTTIYVYVPADTVYSVDTVYVNPESGLVDYGKKRLDTEFAWAELWIANSVVHFYLYQKEKEIAKTIEKAIKEHSTSETIILPPIIIEVPAKISWWQQTMMKLGYLLLIMVGTIVGWFLIKTNFKPF